MNPHGMSFPQMIGEGLMLGNPFLKGGLHVEDCLIQQHNLLKVLEKGDFLFVLPLGGLAVGQ